MKKVTVQIVYDDERFQTLQIYLKQKSISLDDELQKAMDALYKKHVPVGVRRYFAMRNEESIPTATKTKGE